MKETQKKILAVLIVEDEAAVSGVLRDNLENEGFEVFIATDGEEGLNMALKEKPDLILLDILLPKIDGTTVMQKLREDSWGKTVPIILLTNLEADAEKMRRVAKDEPAYYMVKSAWKMEDVVAKVKEVLETDKK